MSPLDKKITELWYKVALCIEKVISMAVLVGVIIFIFASIPVLLQADWSMTETLYELIYRVLIAIIGLELVRMLMAHSITAVLELLAFVIARKMLNPNLESLDIILSVSAFTLLMAARYYFTGECHNSKKEKGKEVKKV